MLDPGLEGRVALVTGTDSPCGIGHATADALAAQGAKVLRHRYEDGADLSNPQTIPALFERAEREFGPVEILVNNAAAWERDTFLPSGAQTANPFDDLWTGTPKVVTAAGFTRLFDVNARAPALMIAEFARRHIVRGANWGRIINISTDGAAVFPSEITYAASKLALESYTRSAAAELGRYGITVNALALGPVRTGAIPPDLERAVLPSIPLAKIGAPEDVADVVVFLASHQARWLTGQKVFLGGGHAM